MSNIPSELKYVESHEWLSMDANGVVTVGITDHAQELLGDIVFVELPKVGAELASGDQSGVVESVKAASDVYSPIAGVVLEINETLEADPQLANTEPYTQGWFFKIRPTNPADYDALMDAAAYASEIGE
jgi:glycine cleavage system H protein